MRNGKLIVASALVLALSVACSTIPRGFDLAPDGVLTHAASGTRFPEQVTATDCVLSRTGPSSYNPEATDVSVNYQSKSGFRCNLDWYVFPATTPTGPLGLRNQHRDFIQTVVRMHSNVRVEDDAFVEVTQDGKLQQAMQATLTYSGFLGGLHQEVFSLLLEFEYERWFVSYRLDAPLAERARALELLRQFVGQASLPMKEWTPKTTDFFGLVWTGTPQSVQAAINSGADVNAADKNGKTPLMYAAGYSRNPAVITVLLDAGAEVNQKEPTNGITPLMFAAAANPNPEALGLLLKAGADLGARSKAGVSVLMFAVAYNDNPDIIGWLLKAGADPKVKNDAGKTAQDIARQYPSLRGTDAFRILQEASM
jgi:hypothetical protein